MKIILLLLSLISSASAAPTQCTIRNPRGETLPIQQSDGTRKSGIIFNGFDIAKTALTTQVFEEGFSVGIDTITVWNEFTVGGGTISVADSQATFTTSAAGDEARIATQLTHSFLHGFSNIWRTRLKTVDTGEVSGSTRAWGVFDDNNGYFFKLDGEGLHVVIRRKAVDVVISSSSFLTPIVYTGNAHSYAIQYLNGNRVIFYYDGILIHQAASQAQNLVALSQLRTTFDNKQSITSGDKILEVYGLAVIREGVPFQFDTAGNLKVSGGAAEAPAGTDPVSSPAVPRVTIGPNATIDSFFTITTGKTLTIQVLEVAAMSAGTGKGIVATLFEDPNGDLSVLNEVKTLMGNNINEERVIDRTFAGDGTRRILLRVEQIGAASMIISREWEGFEQ